MCDIVAFPNDASRCHHVDIETGTSWISHDVLKQVRKQRGIMTNTLEQTASRRGATSQTNNPPDLQQPCKAERVLSPGPWSPNEDVKRVRWVEARKVDREREEAKAARGLTGRMTKGKGKRMQRDASSEIHRPVTHLTSSNL